MDPIRQAEVVIIDDPSQVAAAKRAARNACKLLSLSEEDGDRAELVAVELANNILQHTQHHESAPAAASAPKRAKAGRLLFSSDALGTAVQIMAIDSGPGMASIERSIEDGFTTRSTPGLGLGAVQRLSTSMEIFSEFKQGTIISAFVRKHSKGGMTSPPDVVALSTAAPRETVSGDVWAIVRGITRDLYMVVDGLGHGPFAYEAATVAERCFLSFTAANPDISLTQLIEQIHPPMQSTWGSAIAIVAVMHATDKVICCGVGNIKCSLHSSDGRSQGMVSHNGTLGHQIRRVQEFEYCYNEKTLLIIHSDGMSTHWKLSNYQNLAMQSPASIAGVLYRDFFAWTRRCHHPRWSPLMPTGINWSDRQPATDGKAVSAKRRSTSPVTGHLLSLSLIYQADFLLARQRAKQIAGLLGFEPQDQTRVPTAVSEITCNAIQYVGTRRVEYLYDATPIPQLRIVVRDQGKGIGDLQVIWTGRYKSTTGMGMGLIGQVDC